MRLKRQYEMGLQLRNLGTDGTFPCLRKTKQTCGGRKNGGTSSLSLHFFMPLTQPSLLSRGTHFICSVNENKSDTLGRWGPTVKSSTSFGDIGPGSLSRPSANRRRGRALNERIVKNDILWHRHCRRSH
jgi:hypothetical protein